MTKITLVGAGSVVFAKTLIGDILQYPDLENAHIALMDIDPRRLKTAKLVADKIVAQLGVPATISATLDLEEACRGAKYVVTTIQVGGYKPATVVDFEIPKKYGLKQTIADTLGVGGVFRALRTIHPLIDVARTIQRVGAPDPIMLNYSNPMAMNMWAIDRATGISSVGLCHSVQGTSRNIANYCGLKYDDVTYKVAGINHMAFFLEFRYQGKDAYPLLFEALDDPEIYGLDKVRFEMMRRLGYFVTESSEHQSEYTPHFIHHGDAIIKEFGIPIDEYIRRCESIISTWKQTEEKMVNPAAKVGIKRSMEYGSQIINSCETNEPAVVYGNVPNRGLITNLPEGCSVEVPCLIDAQGIQPTIIGDLPPQLASICRTNINVQELTVEAALTGKREHIYHAVMADPHTAATLPLDKIWSMCDEMIEAHQANGHLGEFESTWPNTGRSAASLQKVIGRIEPAGFIDMSSDDSMDFTLIVENRTEAVFDETIKIHPCSGFTLASGDDFSLTVAPGETIRLPFSIDVAGGNEGGLTLAFGQSPETFIGIGLNVPHRERYVVDATTPEIGVNITFSGDDVAVGTTRPTDSGWTIDFRVSDTDIKTSDSAKIRRGSRVEVQLRNPQTIDKTTVYTVQPNPGQPAVFKGNTDITDQVTVTVTADKGGYDLHLELPSEVLPVGTREPVLLDFLVTVNALGDAHGTTRATWNQKSSDAHMALVIPEQPVALA